MNKDTILKLMGMLGGRKFIVTVISTLVLAFVPNLSPEIVASIAGVAASFILGQAYADGATGGLTSTTTPDK
jgi:hypothetical protein